jgi:hypothetical protein
MQPSKSSKELVPDAEKPGKLESARLRAMEKSMFWNIARFPGLGRGGRGKWRGRPWCLHPTMLEMDPFA